MALPVTSRTVNFLSNEMEKLTAMSQLEFSMCGYASLLCYLPHTWACLHPLSTSLHLWKGGGVVLQYSAECPQLSEAHLIMGTTQDKEKRGNLFSAHMGPVVSSGADDPTVDHRCGSHHDIQCSPPPHSQSTTLGIWPSRAVLKGS